MIWLAPLAGLLIIILWVIKRPPRPTSTIHSLEPGLPRKRRAVAALVVAVRDARTSGKILAGLLLLTGIGILGLVLGTRFAKSRRTSQLRALRTAMEELANDSGRGDDAEPDTGVLDNGDLWTVPGGSAILYRYDIGSLLGGLSVNEKCSQGHPDGMETGQG